MFNIRHASANCGIIAQIIRLDNLGKSSASIIDICQTEVGVTMVFAICRSVGLLLRRVIALGTVADPVR